MSLRVSFGETRTLSMATGEHWFPGISTMQDGSLHLGIGLYPDAMRSSPADVVAITLQSIDGGRNWKLHRTHYTPHGHGREVEFSPLRNGTVLERPYRLTVRSRGRVVAETYRSRDEGRTFPECFDAPMEFPEGLEPLNDDLRGWFPPGREHALSVFFGKLVELDDGDLLATVYGDFRKDRLVPQPIGAMDQPLGDGELPRTRLARKNRCVVVRSTDQGESWKYLATVAYDPEATMHFNEPAMARLKNGDLLCVMRTEGGGTPLYQARSTDEGRTWSRPEPVGFNGVAPDLIVLENGVVACCFGRPGDQLILSEDHGKTWSYHQEIFSGGPLQCGPSIPGHASYPGTTGYAGLTEMKENTILYVYDHLGVVDLRTREPGLLNTIKAVEIAVERTGGD